MINLLKSIPVICIDGPSGSGKGTLSAKLAVALGWHLLDSGAMYRATSYAALLAEVDLDDGIRTAEIAASLPVRFVQSVNGINVILADVDVTNDIRSVQCAEGASVIARHGSVRSALLERQRDFRIAPGLIADGRDMGTVVFPAASLKFFLQASFETRIERRRLQLQALGEDVSLARLRNSVMARDERDRRRDLAPLQPAKDAIIVDSTSFSADMVFEQVWNLVCENINEM